MPERHEGFAAIVVHLGQMRVQRQRALEIGQRVAGMMQLRQRAPHIGVRLREGRGDREGGAIRGDGRLMLAESHESVAEIVVRVGVSGRELAGPAELDYRLVVSR